MGMQGAASAAGSGDAELATTGGARQGRWILLVLLAINLAAIGLVGLSLYASYSHHVEKAINQTVGLAEILDQNLQAAIDRVDTALSLLADQRQRQLDAGQGAFSVDLDAVRSRLPWLNAIRIVDANGMIVHGTNPSPGTGTYLGDREYFAPIRDTLSNAPYISPPLMGRLTNEWSVVIGRRVSLADGSFGGMVLASVPVSHFTRLFASLDLGPQGTVSWRSSEFGIIARYPDTVRGQAVVGQKSASREFSAMVQADPEMGSYRAISAVDGVERVFSYRRISNLNQHILVGLGVADFMGQWRSQAGWLVSMALAFLVVSLVSGLLLAHAWRAQARALSDIRVTSQYLEGVLRHAPIGLAIVGLDRTFRMANSQLASLFGVAEDRLVGSSTSMIYGDHAQFEALGEAAYPVVSRGGTFATDQLIKRVDGGAFWCHIKGRMIDMAWPELGVAWTFEDITEQRAQAQALSLTVEKLTDANAELERFAYVASHDLREPLRTIMAFTGLLKRRLGDKLDGDCGEFMDLITDSTNRMNTLIGDLLTYSRTSNAKPQMVDLSLEQCCQAALRNLTMAIDETGAQIDVQPLPTIQGDPILLMQLFQNLMANAIKFHRPEQSPRISVSAVRQGAEWQVMVADNGIGIPEDAQDVFEVFRRLHTQQEYSGSGIGLATCRRIVMQHGGRIWHYPNDGGGTVFAFTFPVEAASTSEG